jgi:hypothetical protein
LKARDAASEFTRDGQLVHDAPLANPILFDGLSGFASRLGYTLR